MVFELRMKTQHNCPFLEYASSFSVPVHSYCSRDYDILEFPIPISEKQLELASELFPHVEDWKVINSHTGSKSYIVMNCLCEELYDESITSMIQKSGGILEYPIRYIDGYEYHKIRCLSKETLSHVLEKLEQLPFLEVIAIEDIGDKGLFRSQMISAVDILETLTPKQLEILIKAFEGGYYQIPRDIRTQDIAEDEGVSRYAIEKSLRKAENKIIAAIMPYLLFQSNKSIASLLSQDSI